MSDQPRSSRESYRQQGQPPRTPRPAGSGGSGGPQVMPGGNGSGNSGRAGGGRRKRSPWKPALAITTMLLVGGVATAVGIGWKTLHNIGGGTAGGTKSLIDSITHPRDSFPAQDRINVLLIGKDYNYTVNKRDKSKNGIRYTKGARSDSILLLSLDLANQKVSALSIPRDTKVTAPDGKVGKINATYSRGGPKLLEQTVEQLIGVKPDYYIAVKPDAVKAIVDSLGGVQVETIDWLKYDDWWGHLHVDMPKGRQSINGEQAVGFARFREADVHERHPDGSPVLDGNGEPILKRHVDHSKEEGDPRRMARQQQLIRAMAAQAKSPTNWLKLDQIINTGYGQLETDLKIDKVFALAALFRSIQPDQVQSGSLQGKGVKGSWGYYFEPDPEKTKALVDWLVKGDDTAANRLTVVAVQNATNVPGLASRVAAMLREQGFDAKNAGSVEAGDKPVDADSTRIVYGKASVAPRVEKIRQLLGGGQAVKEVKPDTQGEEGYTHEDADVTIILGRDLATNFTQRSAQR